MKAKLLVSQSGLAAGATYEIDGQPGLRNVLLKNGDVIVSVPLADLVIEAPASAPERAPEHISFGDYEDYLQEKRQMQEQGVVFYSERPAAAPVKPEVQTELLPEHVYIDEVNEDLARGFYDEYCEAAGGKAYNGDPLPPADEFFVDPLKARQANAYRAAIAKMVPPESYSMESDDREPGAPRFPRAVAALQREIETLATNEPIHRSEGREEQADHDIEALKDLHGAIEALTLDDAPQETLPTPDAPNYAVPVESYSEQTALDDELDAQLEASQKTESPLDDTDLDEPLPEKQADCTEGESCDSCQ